ncbi:hypothetical protein D0N36_19050 [Hymenobacter lapidiphilus]|uniref:hypothetical protein n=1 Tax=Hymenobacter sp. CCM 8763 TaxID=2303334 RepID=UPI000E353E4A|nr:hypothetical protein [Hymenobacter sp. CCM 8763]RFP63485.1 hypothetical protein D0N36_19050 [Hymenobacter sp. CCM 8763]
MRSYPPSVRLLLAGSLLLALPGCLFNSDDSPPKEQLPPATQQGLNEGGCRIDGTVWKPAQVLFGPKKLYISVDRRTDNTPGYRFSLSLVRRADASYPNAISDVDLYVPNLRGVGSIALNQSFTPGSGGPYPAHASFDIYTDPSNSTTHTVYYTGPSAPGQLTITRFDTVARVVSGTFEFVGRAATGQQVSATEGRFDVGY